MSEVVVFRGASTDTVAKETGKSWLGGFGLEPKLRLMLESSMHLIVLGEYLGSLGENLGLGKAFLVGLEVEIKGGEARDFNDDEVFMFRNKGNGKKRKRLKKTIGRERRYLRIIREELLELRDGERIKIISIELSITRQIILLLFFSFFLEMMKK